MPRVYRPHPPVQWNWITLAGPDAQDFLHRLTTVHVRALQPGDGAPGFFLTAQGKVRAQFTLWNYAPGEYGFEFDAGSTETGGQWKQGLLTAIDQFTFAEKMTLTDVTGAADPILESRWIFFEDGETVPGSFPKNEPNGTLKTAALDEEIRVCNHGSASYGKTWFTVWGRPQRLAQWLEREFPEASPMDHVTLEQWRILAGRPGVNHEITDSSIPLELGLRHGIADDKGCYPGQEVIERIISLGAPARRLARIDGQGAAPAIGDKIFNDAEPPAEVGQVTSVTATARGFTALGMLRKIHAKEGLAVRFGEAPPAAASGTVVQVAPYA